MVLNVQLVANIFALSIYWKRFSVSDIVDEQWNQFLRELVYTIVIRAICHDSRHTIYILICSYKVVRTCFARAVWAMRIWSSHRRNHHYKICGLRLMLQSYKEAQSRKVVPVSVQSQNLISEVFPEEVPDRLAA